MNNIYVFNAPKRCGKDSVADYLAAWYTNWERGSFKEPMFDMLAAAMGFSDRNDHLMRLYESEGWKDRPNPALDGRTPRDMMIHISEVFFKSFFGKDVFGRRLADHIENNEAVTGKHNWAISDGGFPEEIEALVERFGERVVIVQFQRDGFRDFEGDSRNWLNMDGVETLKFDTTDMGYEGLALEILKHNDSV